MSKEKKLISQRGEIWSVDYNYQPKSGQTKEWEIAIILKKSVRLWWLVMTSKMSMIKKY